MSVPVDSTGVNKNPARPDLGLVSDAGRTEGARVLQFAPARGPRSRSRNRATTPLGISRNEGPDPAAVIERMTDATMRLARRNEALEDFATLVAHELKSPLEAALLAPDPRTWIASALDLVESLLQAATASPDEAYASLSGCLADAAVSLHQHNVLVKASYDAQFPLSPASLSVILRNLLVNAAAAKARHVEVSVAHRKGRWWLVVDDDGVGLDAGEDDYSSGSGIGFELCRRIAERNGGRLELLPRTGGGTRAILRMERAA